MPELSDMGAEGASDVHPGLSVWAICAWVIVQLIALGLGAAGVRLWAHHPAPAESLAVQEMVVIQIIASSMLFPILLPNFSTAVVVVALVWPFVHLAGFLSVTEESLLLRGCAYVSIWIGGLWACNTRLRGQREQLVGICLAEMFTLGGVVLFYLRIESITGAVLAERFGPLVGAVCQVNGQGQSCISWFEAGLPWIVGVGLWINRRGSAFDSKQG